MTTRVPALTLLLIAFATPAVWGQGNTTAGLTGFAAGSALGSASQASSAAASQPAGAGGSTPIEIQMMTYQGLQSIAADIAAISAKSLCGTGGCDGSRAILIEDPTSAIQIAMYQAAEGYFNQLSLMHNGLNVHFSLRVTPQSLKFPIAAEQDLKLVNTGPVSLTHVRISKQGDSSNAFSVGTSCPDIAPNGSCTLKVKYTQPAAAPPGNTYSAQLIIADAQVKTTQTVQLSATYVPAHGVAAPAAAPLGAAAPGAAVGTGSSTSPASAPTTPLWITETGALSTALGALKSGMTYTATSFQPTTQSLEILVENELKTKGLSPYTSTSALDLTDATNKLTETFARMLKLGSDVNDWVTLCKPPAGASTTANSESPAPNLECNDPEVTTNLAVAQQLITGYTNLIQTASDGNGNPVLVDILRGRILSDKLNVGMPSLQLAVAAAAGNTRTNVWFLLDIFWVPPPSYNAGAIVTFELRDEKNALVRSGARTAFFKYRWIKGNKIDSHRFETKNVCGDKDTFCAD